MTTLKDNRKYQAMTVADADELFLKIARLKAILDRKSAAHKKRLADLEIAHKEDVASELSEYELLTGELADYIQAHKERFLSPRKHKVAQIGSYGITTDPAYVTIEDEEKLFAYALENGYDDMINTKRTANKDAVLRHAIAGEIIPGAAVVPPGDVVKFSFSKGYAENLQER